jgi:hypothetical protein
LCSLQLYSQDILLGSKAFNHFVANIKDHFFGDVLLNVSEY